MMRSIMVIFLITIILSLAVPLSFDIYEIEEAFTADNLIVLNNGKDAF